MMMMMRHPEEKHEVQLPRKKSPPPLSLYWNTATAGEKQRHLKENDGPRHRSERLEQPTGLKEKESPRHGLECLEQPTGLKEKESPRHGPECLEQPTDLKEKESPRHGPERLEQPTDLKEKESPRHGPECLEHPTDLQQDTEVLASLYPKIASMSEQPAELTMTDASVLETERPAPWQRGKNVVDCNRHMLEDQVDCDLWFRVGAERKKEDREEEREVGERVGAHAYVLRSRSAAFQAMLKREEERGGGEIELPRTSPRAFWQLLRYLYYEELSPEADTALELLNLALSYDVLVLRDACLRFLQGCLAVGTVCAVLEAAHRCHDQCVLQECLSFVRQHGEEVLQSPGMMQLSSQCLEKVLTLDGLDLTTLQRQDVEDRWARSHHQDVLGEPSPDSQHQPLEDYVKKHHEQSCRYFPRDARHKLLPSKHGKSKSRKSRSTEVGRSTKSSEEPLLPRTPSSEALRDLEQVTRFTQVEGSHTNTGRTADALSFSINHDVLLYGFGIYGSETRGEASYEVKTALSRDRENMSVLSQLLGKDPNMVLEVISITGVGEVLPIMLKEPVRLKGGKTYILEIYVKGPPSHCGASGHSRVKVGPMTFTFGRAASVKGNRTDVRTGQIPCLYYLPY